MVVVISLTEFVKYISTNSNLAQKRSSYTHFTSKIMGYFFVTLSKMYRSGFQLSFIDIGLYE